MGTLKRIEKKLTLFGKNTLIRIDFVLFSRKSRYAVKMEPIHSFSTLSVLLTSIIIATSYAEQLQIRQYGCMVNHDCPIDEPICENSICIPGILYGCGSTDDCPRGEGCSLDGYCITAPQNGCMVNHDCLEGTICENNICIPGNLYGCGSTDDCPKGEVCGPHAICITAPAPPQKPQIRQTGLGCMVNHDCPQNEPICSDEHICVPGVVPYPCNTTSECPQMTTCGWGSTAQKRCARYHGIPPWINCTVNHDCPPFDPSWGCNKEIGYCGYNQIQMGCMTTDECAKDYICSEQKICVPAPGPEPYWCWDNQDCPPMTPYCDMQQWFCV